MEGGHDPARWEPYAQSPRRREIGSSVPRMAWGRERSERHDHPRATTRICSSRKGRQARLRPAAGLRFLGGRQPTVLTM